MFLRILAIITLLSVTPIQAQENFWSQPAIIKCCSQADALFADEWEFLPDGSVKATVTDIGPRKLEWGKKLIGKTYIIPKDKVTNIEGNFQERPSRPLIFISPWDNEHVYCFVPGVLI